MNRDAWTPEQYTSWREFARHYNKARRQFDEFCSFMSERHPGEVANLVMLTALMLRAEASLRGATVSDMLEGVRLALEALAAAENMLGRPITDRIDPGIAEN